MIDAAGGLLVVALRFVAVTATTGALGAWAFYRFVLPRLSDAVMDAERRGWHVLATRIAMWCSTAVALSALARLQVPGSVLPLVSDAADSFVRSIGWKTALWAQFSVAVLAALMLSLGMRRSSWRAIGADACMAALVLVTPALAHAGAARDLRAVAYAVDLAHGAAAGAWVGALAIVTLLVARLRGTDRGASNSAALFVAFHPVAVVAAPLVFLTGLATAWLRMGAPEGIANPAYSALFVAKLLLAGVVGYFGAGHSKLAIKRAQSVAPEPVWRTLMAECAFAVVVLLVTAVLVGTPPIG